GLVTTGKDWARLGERWDRDLPLWVLEVEARIEDVEPVLELLDRSCARGMVRRAHPTLPDRSRRG
ncbi:MAG: hypothetical protein Q8L00_05115, partial [Deltaproteobacteria bacterium]|nr:hypothetical protein [Deltaproteobacteria bacterium]